MCDVLGGSCDCGSHMSLGGSCVHWRQSSQKMETSQSPWSSRTVEWQSSQLNAVTFSGSL